MKKVQLEVKAEELPDLKPIRAIIFNKGTGETVKTMTCSKRDAPLNVQEGEDWREATAEDVLKQDTPFYTPTPEEREKGMRKRRDTLLMESDWTRNPERPLDPETAARWSAYRSTLFDLPDQFGWPFEAKWPEEPR